MLKIAICDDEKVFRDNINKYVAAYLNEKEISYEIDTFSSGKEIIDLGIEIKQYNIIFLDIRFWEPICNPFTASCPPSSPCCFAISFLSASGNE